MVVWCVRLRFILGVLLICGIAVGVQRFVLAPYSVRCVYAQTMMGPIPTNETGEVVVDHGRTGNVVTGEMIARPSLRCVCTRERLMELAHRFRTDAVGCAWRKEDVERAFSNLKVTVEGVDVAEVQLTTRAHTKELGRSVLQFVYDQLEREVREENERLVKRILDGCRQIESSPHVPMEIIERHRQMRKDIESGNLERVGIGQMKMIDLPF